MALTAWLAPSMVPVYLHTLRVRVRRHRHGHTRHPGDAAAVIRACIEACWNGRTFTASPGHFDMFWTRDLGFSTPSLVRSGRRGAGAGIPGLCARRTHAAPESRHHHDQLWRPPGRRLRVRRRFAAAPAGRSARGRRPRPCRTPSRLAGGRGRVVRPAGHRPGDWPRPFGPHVQRAPRHGRQPEHRLRQHDGRAAREDPRRDALAAVTVRAPLRGRLRPAPARTFLGRRSLPRRARGRHRVGRSQRVAVLRGRGRR